MALRQKSLPKLSSSERAERSSSASHKGARRNTKVAGEKAKVTVVPSDPNLKAILVDASSKRLSVQCANSEVSTARKVEEAKESLGSLESEVISALFPESGMPESFDEVAARLGMSPLEVKEIADNALRGLRGPKRTPRTSSAWN